MSRWLRREWRSFTNLGLPSWIRYQVQTRRIRRNPQAEPFLLTSRHARYPLLCRAGSSDFDVFYQVFVAREFSCLDDLDRPGLIIDCGAYVGYASSYFASRFPGSDVIAVEPDQENFQLLVQNLEPFGPRVRPIRAGVWSQPTSLKIDAERYRDGREWSHLVRECDPRDPASLPAVDIGGLLQESGHDRVSILKMDIEGAEAVVFATNYEHWIDLVDVLAVEIHQDSTFGDARAAFSRAIDGRGFSTSRSGELTVCRR